MTTQHHGGRLLLGSALLLAGMAAHANGYAVTPMQESEINPGMTMDQVQQTLGKPATRERFGNEPGPTWSYNVPGTGGPDVVFDVDFSAGGTVISSGQRMLPEHPFGSH